MPKVTFSSTLHQFQKTVDAHSGQTLLEIAIQNDIAIQHSCGGYCACTTCHVHVMEGANALSVQQEDEVDRIAGVDRQTSASRLGCQTKIGNSDVKVEMINYEG